MGCGASAEVEKKQYAFRVRVLGGLNLYNNGFGFQAPGTYSNAGRFDGASDPYCIVECSGSKQRFETDVQLHTQNPVWNQEFYFNSSTKAPILTLTVKDKDVLSKDDVLGTAKVNLNGLLSRTGERICWLPLEGCKAKAEIGIAVIEAFRTVITAKQGVDVKPMDALTGSSDVYMTLGIGQQAVQKTAVKGWTLNPVWNQSFTFFLPYGLRSQVAMILYDKDSVGVDTNMGWHYEYFDGKPQKGTRDLKTAITNAQGSLHFTITDDETVEAVAEAPPVTEEMKKAFPRNIPTSCTFDIRVLGAYNLAASDHNFAGDFANDINSWGWHEFKEYTGTSDPFARVTCEGVTYDTRHINNTLEPVWNEKFRFVTRDRENNKVRIEVLDHDLAVNDSIGAVEIPLKAMKPGKRQEIWSFLDKGRGEIGVEVVQHHQIHVRVVKAEGLPAKDMNGMCDPYVKLSLGGQEYKTRIVRNDRNPWFEEDFRFCLPVVTGLQLHLECWDSDFALFKKSMSEDTMGIAKVDLNGLIPGIANEFTLPLTVAGKAEGKLTVIITEEIPVPESALADLQAKGKEAYEATMKKLNEAKEMVACLKLPDFDKKEEATFEVADTKLAPRPRFGRINVDVVALRSLQGVDEPYYVGVSLPLQGKRYKTKEYRGTRGVDIGETFTFPVPSRLTGGLEFSVCESARHPYTEWSQASAAKSQLPLRSLNGGDGTVRGSAADDEWLKLSDGKGQIVVRVYEQFRFQIRILGGTDIKTKADPYVVLAIGETSRKTSYVSADPKKDRTGGVPGKPVWDEQFTFFSHEKGMVAFKLMDLSVTGDEILGKGEFDLRQIRRGVLHKCDVVLNKGGTLQIEILEEEKMALLDRIIDAAANAQKLAAALAAEVAANAAKAATEAAASVTGALGGIGAGIGKLF